MSRINEKEKRKEKESQTIARTSLPPSYCDIFIYQFFGPVHHFVLVSILISSHCTALHCGPSSAPHRLLRKGVTFSRKEEKRERRRGRKREKKWEERGHDEHRSPGGQLLILSSPSATFAILHDLVRSFPPTGAQLPYHVTTKPTNQSCS